jgi:hypothetical protein
VVLAITAVALSLPVAASAKDECSDEDTGKRLKCNMEKASESFGALVDTATQDDMEFFSENQKKQLVNLKERAKNETVRVNALDYKRYGKKDDRDVECVIRERIGDVRAEDDANGNGVCDEGEFCIGNEDGVCQEEEFVLENPYKGGCAELLDDGVGDDDGICDPKGQSGQFRETCLEDCGQDVILAENVEKNIDVDRAAAVEQSLQDLTAVIDEANADLGAMIAARRAWRSSKATRLAEPVTPCEELEMLLQEGRRVDALGLAFAQSTASVAKVTEDACKDTLQFDAITTASAACLPSTLIGEGLNVLAVRLEAIDDADTGDRVDAIGRCLQVSGGEVQELKAMLLSIKTLLLSPQGRNF